MAEQRTGILVILDGFGINPETQANAIALAKTPCYDALLKRYPHTHLDASEKFVGLPQGFMGNSEVGHLNIGAGRVVYQDFSQISHAIETGTFFENPAFVELAQAIKAKGRKAALHLMGLVSDGGVHSHILHLHALLRFAKQAGIPKTFVHVFTDGRDTSPTLGKKFVGDLVEFCRSLEYGQIETVMGRFYAMDRDKRWERTKEAYDAIVSCAGEVFSNPLTYVENRYEQGVTDEFIPPGVSRDYAGIKDGDGILFFNFRADRARQLTHALTDKDFREFSRERTPELAGFVMMTPYDETISLPRAYEKPKVPNTLGEVVSRAGWKQLRIAETEKYAHVTYFFNGGEETAFAGEKRVLVPSPRDVKTYDLKPEMSAFEVSEKLIQELSTKQYRFAVVNYANADMVGHTGNLGAAIRAVETIDQCLKKIVDWVEANGAFCVITADHGNCEKMFDAQQQPLTSHTMLPVPFIVVDPAHRDLQLSPGSLCDIAPTLLRLWGVTPPVEMTGKSLIQS